MFSINPVTDNFQRWALCLNADDLDVTFEATGSHPLFQPDVEYSRPEHSKNYVGKVFVATISDEDIQRVYDVSDATPVNNRNVEWDCQDYVLDVLDRLENECILSTVQPERN